MQEPFPERSASLQEVEQYFRRNLTNDDAIINDLLNIWSLFQQHLNKDTQDAQLH